MSTRLAIEEGRTALDHDSEESKPYVSIKNLTLAMGSLERVSRGNIRANMGVGSDATGLRVSKISGTFLGGEF